MIPLIGEPIDLGHGFVNLATGDLDDAAISFGGMWVLGQGGPASRLFRNASRQAGGDLADLRKSIGMPPGEGAVARLDIGGQSFYGNSAHDLPVDIAPLNAISRSHAEAHVFQQAKNARVSSRQAVMFVDRPLCMPCGAYGGVGSMMRSIGVEDLFVNTPDGWFLIRSVHPSTPTPLG